MLMKPLVVSSRAASATAPSSTISAGKANETVPEISSTLLTLTKLSSVNTPESRLMRSVPLPPSRVIVVPRSVPSTLSRSLPPPAWKLVFSGRLLPVTVSLPKPPVMLKAKSLSPRLLRSTLSASPSSAPKDDARPLVPTPPTLMVVSVATLPLTKAMLKTLKALPRPESVSTAVTFSMARKFGRLIVALTLPCASLSCSVSLPRPPLSTSLPSTSLA